METDSQQSKSALLPIALTAANLLLLYGGYATIETAVPYLNRIPNISGGRPLLTVNYWLIGAMVALVPPIAISCGSRDSRTRRFGQVGAAVWGGAAVLGWIPCPVAILTEFACAFAAAIFALGFLRIPFAARALQWHAGVAVLRAAVALWSTIGFAMLSLLWAKRCAMCFRID